MSALGQSRGTWFAGLAGAALVYFGFIMRLVIEAYRANAALGVPTTFLIVFREPLFWLLAVTVFMLVFWLGSVRQK